MKMSDGLLENQMSKILTTFQQDISKEREKLSTTILMCFDMFHAAFAQVKGTSHKDLEFITSSADNFSSGHQEVSAKKLLESDVCKSSKMLEKLSSLHRCFINEMGAVHKQLHSLKLLIKDFKLSASLNNYQGKGDAPGCHSESLCTKFSSGTELLSKLSSIDTENYVISSELQTCSSESVNSEDSDSGGCGQEQLAISEAPLKKHLKTFSGSTRSRSCESCSKKSTLQPDGDHSLPPGIGVEGKFHESDTPFVKEELSEDVDFPKKILTSGDAVSYFSFDKPQPTTSAKILFKPYHCKDCNKSFLYYSALTRHSRIHTGERPYACQLCLKSFKQRCHLMKHLKIHSRIATLN